MYLYRLITRDGYDAIGESLLMVTSNSKPKELNGIKWQMNEWLPVTTNALKKERTPNEEGEMIETGKKIPTSVATIARFNYDAATITHSPSKGETLAVVYRATRLDILNQIANPFPHYDPNPAANTYKAGRNRKVDGRPSQKGTQRNKGKKIGRGKKK